MRNWSDINPSTIPRPMRKYSTTRRGQSRITGYTGSQFGVKYPIRSSYYTETGQKPYVSRFEILDDLQKKFNTQPLTHKIDPKTGKVIVTRTMDRTEMPSEMAGTRWSNLFGQGEPLTSQWVLPKGALTGDRFITRRTPQSDYDRTRQHSGYGFGRWSAGGHTRATLNPQTFWPSSAFTTPMRGAAAGAAGYSKPEPVFGGTVDYTTGRWHTPPSAYGYSDPYGQFNPRFKQPPRIGAWKRPRPLGKKEEEDEREGEWERKRVQLGGGVSAMRWVKKRDPLQEKYDVYMKRKRREDMKRTLMEDDYL